VGGSPNAMVAKLAATVSVKMIDSQRWDCRIALLQVMDFSFKIGR
jgi:hypothetical protein